MSDKFNPLPLQHPDAPELNREEFARWIERGVIDGRVEVVSEAQRHYLRASLEMLITYFGEAWFEATDFVEVMAEKFGTATTDYQIARVVRLLEAQEGVELDDAVLVRSPLRPGCWRVASTSAWTWPWRDATVH